MRRFSSYGPVDKDVHYYAPREELIDFAYNQLMGDNPRKGGHYITVWAPRQCGKTWTMQQILSRLQKNPSFDVLKINLEILKEVEDTALVMDCQKHLHLNFVIHVFIKALPRFLRESFSAA